MISPGPCTPNEAGISVPLIQRFAGKIPILGVCLGHQAIGQAFGGTIVRARARDARQAVAGHARRPRRIRRPAVAVRRRRATIRSRSSAATLPACLEVTATADDGEIMGVRHRELPVEGVQFHPGGDPDRARPRAAREFSRRHRAGAARGEHIRRIGIAMTITAAGSAAAHDRAPRDLPRRDAVADAPDHERRGDAGDDRGAHRRACASRRRRSARSPPRRR